VQTGLRDVCVHVEARSGELLVAVTRAGAAALLEALNRGGQRFEADDRTRRLLERVREGSPYDELRIDRAPAELGRRRSSTSPALLGDLVTRAWLICDDETCCSLTLDLRDRGPAVVVADDPPSWVPRRLLCRHAPAAVGPLGAGVIREDAR
jgi:hypothetical protein